MDANGNALTGDVVAVDCTNSYVRAESRLVAVTGLDGCIVVETKDAVLVVPKASAQDVKKIVEELERRGRPETKLGREVFRPWGSYDSLDGAMYDHPGGSRPASRSSASPCCLARCFPSRCITAGPSTGSWSAARRGSRGTTKSSTWPWAGTRSSPLGARHRIENPGTDTLRIIEVQVGDYLGEDDIVRFEDRYGRQGRTD